MKCVLKCPHNATLYGGSREPVNLKGNCCRILLGRTNVEVEAPILWPPDVKSLLIGKDPDAGTDAEAEAPILGPPDVKSLLTGKDPDAGKD